MFANPRKCINRKIEIFCRLRIRQEDIAEQQIDQCVIQKTPAVLKIARLDLLFDFFIVRD